MKLITDKHKEFFEQCFRDGDTEIMMGGVPLYVREAYREYYARRKEDEQKI